jgi:TonB-linked SusC/RagA family outer membrane protein
MFGLLSPASAMAADNNAAKDIASTAYTTNVVQQSNRTVKGRVTDSNGEPLVGVTVTEKGTKNSTITDIDGRFTLSVRPNAKVDLSYVGFANKTVQASSNMAIQMQEDDKELNEVVVVGYGTQKKVDLTGAVTSVDVNKALSSRPIADVGRGLQGVVPGMNVVVPTGEVGSDPIIKIRGQVASISGNNNPLILLDNVEIPSIQMVNPNDIESISVLKDAAASSIYGAKAAFGVVLITTKKGAKTDKFEVSYTNNFSFQHIAKDIDMAGIDGLRYTLDAQINRGASMPAGGFWRIDEDSYQKALEWQEKYGGTVKYNDPVVYGRDWYYDGTNKYGYRIYDGVKAMIRDWAPTSQHNLSVNGKSGKTSYNIGLGLLNQDGMMRTAKHDDFRRYNAKINVSSELNKYVTVRAGALYSDRNKRYPGVGTTVADPWLYLYRWSRLMPEGVNDQFGNNLREPVSEVAQSNTDNLQNKYFNVNLGATINFTKDWDLQVDYTYDHQTTDRNNSVIQYSGGQTWYSPTAWLDDNGQQVYVDSEGNQVDAGTEGAMPGYRFPYQSYYTNNTISSVSNYTYKGNENTLNAYTTYRLYLGPEKAHAFKFMLGMNLVTSNWSSYTGRKTNLIDPENPQFDLASGDQFISADRNWDSQLGYFGRINYAFMDKYLIEANLRRDGSSKFPKDLRWKWFPSFSGGWVFTSEKFMKPVEKVLSFGKIRASWGSIGDQSVSNSLYKSILSSGQTDWIGADGKQLTYFGTPSLVDPNIGWQRIETVDLGIDLRFFNNELGASFDWYNRRTKDMIIPGESMPVTLGTSVPLGNYGELETRGWEVSVDYRHRFANGLGITANFQISDATTKTIRGADYLTPWENRSLSTTFSTGRRYGDIYGYVTDRLFQKDDFVYDDNGKIKTTTVIYKGTARTTHVQNTPYPVYQVAFEDNNKLMCAPGDVKFVDLNGDGYIDNGNNTNGDHGDLKVIGNTTPRYEYSFRIGADYKGFDLSVYCQGIGKRKIWGAGQLAIPDGTPRKALCRRHSARITGQKTIPTPSTPVPGTSVAATPDTPCRCRANTCSTWLTSA